MLLQKLILGFAAQVQAHVLINGTRIKDLTLGTVFPLPPCPLTREDALKILRIGLQLGEVWHGEPEHGILPTLRGSQYISDVARSQVNRAHNAIARVELKPPGAVAMRPADEEKFWRAWGGKEMYHSSRPIVVLMWNTESSNQAYAYIASVGERMLRCSASIGSISLSLYVGWRDWKSATTWQRAKTLLVARGFEIIIETSNARRKASASLSAPLSAQESPGHMPSLTHRQARRSKVTEVQLRRRWA